MSRDRASHAEMSDAFPSPDEVPSGRVIVAGYGPVGRSVADKLDQTGVPTTIIDLNPGTVAQQSRLRRDIIQGDVTDRKVLEAAGITSAAALIVAIPDERAAVQACRLARELNPHLFIAARTNFLSQGMLATEAGADHVVVEEIVTAEAMKQAVVQALLRRRG